MGLERAIWHDPHRGLQHHVDADRLTLVVAKT